ncbi:hypothetical protein SNE40_017088 [Patella caerulea]|uniref:DNA repair protein XRCC1 n=1 Tax=Patella caerulea TaxID=87958 RepID=A0AAN8JB96_PATCE
MPEIKLQHVVSCSSEDKNNPAENLLKPDGTHKWKSATSGLKQVTVVLQFEKSSQIHSVDIGNDGAAFVEILVGKSTASTDQEYQVILVASTFMTPIESRNGNNRNAVRMFGVDKLSKAVAGQKWDRVKIVCTQPFNKNTSYGLSFIRFHSPSDGTEETQRPIKKLGAFTIKSEDGDDIKAGSLFAGRTKDKPTESTPLKGAAAIRAVSKLVEDTKSPSSIERKAASTASPSASASSSKPSPSTVKRKHSGSDDEERTPQTKTPLRKQSTSLSSVSSNKSHEEKAPPLKKIKSEPVKQSPIKEFSKLMEKVIFAMSGYQNPYRGELRDKALEMGGTYKPDWGRGCTHLICAFPNTPKYNQVKGKGKIVNKNWITDCYKQKKLLNWRKYRVGDADSPSESSEEEEEMVRKTPAKTTKSPAVKKTPIKKEPVVYGGESDSSGDTEDELERAREKIKKHKAEAESKAAVKKESDADLYGGSTDEDEPMDTSVSKVKTSPKPMKTAVPYDEEEGSDDSGLPELPDFFTNKTFFLYGEFSDTDKRLLTRYITAYNGELADYMNNDVTYVITNNKWDDNFDDALTENSKLIFVKPKWIHLCHEKSKCLPHQPYIVVPS